MAVQELKPKHVTAWLDSLSVSDSTKAGAAQTVRTAFHWLVREGHIAVNPVAGAKGPSKQRREVILTVDQFRDILKHSRPDFVQLLVFIRETGCRPQEAVAVEARHCELDQRRIVFQPSEAKGKKHPRVIYLNDKALGIVRPLVAKYPEGKILRNAKGKPWNRSMVRQRFLRLRKKVGGSFCAYHLRHTFATDALQRLDPITVASLMGHADASTLARNYQHLAKLPAYMQEAARKATA
jgi:integrase/recombinase XerC